MSKEEYIKVKIRLLGNLRRKYGEINDKKIEMPRQSKIGSLLKKIDIPKDKPKLIMVNGKDEGKDYVLKNGDIVTLFPMILG